MANAVEETIGFISNPWGGASALSTSIGKALGLDNNETIDKAQASLDQVLDKSSSTSAQNRGLYNDYWGKMQGMYGENAGKYNDAVSQLADAIDNYKDFSYGKTTEEFLDPAMAMRQKQAAQQLNAAASSGGNRFSSNYNDKLMAQSQAMASEEWSKAYDRMMQDRAQQLNEWQTGQNKINNLNMLASLYGQDRNQLSNAMGDYYSSLANQNNADLEVYSDITQSKANLDAQRKSGIGGALGSIGSVIGAIF